MPQFEFSSVFWPQLFWLALVFSVLFFGIILPTLPKLGKVVDARESKISGDINHAETAKAQADEISGSDDMARAQSHENARQVIANAKDTAAKSVEKKLAAAGAKIDEKMTVSQANILDARTKALAEIETVAADSAADIVEKLSGVRPAVSAASAAIKAALAAA